MPLTDTEKEKIYEIEALKREIREELRPPKRESHFSEFQQQLIVVIVGFILTAVVGGALTAWWKNRESNNQRQYLAQQRALDKTYSIIEKTSKEVATTIAAADDILATYYGDDWTSREIDERRANWTRTSRSWRVNCQILRSEIAASFSDANVVKTFEQIVQNRVLLGNAIFILPREKKAILQDKDLQTEVQRALDLKNTIVDLLDKCDTLMIANAKKAS